MRKESEGARGAKAAWRGYRVALTGLKRIWDCWRRDGRAESESSREEPLERQVLGPYEVGMLWSKAVAMSWGCSGVCILGQGRVSFRSPAGVLRLKT